MKIHRALVLLILTAALGFGASAGAEDLKFGVVDIDQAFNSTDEGKAAREELQRKQRDAQAEVEPLAQQLREKQDELEAKRFVLSDEALFQRNLDLKELRDRIQIKVTELENVLKMAQTRLEGPLRNKLMATIDEIGKSEGFTAIFSLDAPGLLYTREAIDITDMVIQKYNSKS